MLVNHDWTDRPAEGWLPFDGRWCAAVLSEGWPAIEDVRVGFGEPSCAERVFVLLFSS